MINTTKSFVDLPVEKRISIKINMYDILNLNQGFLYFSYFISDCFHQILRVASVSQI